jgi:hypothetical protein
MWNKGIMLRHTSPGPRFQLDTMQPTPEVQRREGRGEGERGKVAREELVEGGDERWEEDMRGRRR